MADPTPTDAMVEAGYRAYMLSSAAGKDHIRHILRAALQHQEPGGALPDEVWGEKPSDWPDDVGKLKWRIYGLISDLKEMHDALHEATRKAATPPESSALDRADIIAPLERALFHADSSDLSTATRLKAIKADIDLALSAIRGNGGGTT